MLSDNSSTEYINSTDYLTLKSKIADVIAVIDDLTDKQVACRRLRYTEIDIEAEREAGNLAPDEMFLPQHIIDSNIRKEQSAYIQYVTQSPRAVILQDCENPSANVALIERDVTTKLRFNNWQLSMYSTVDSMQMYGYGILELVQDQSQEGELAHEMVNMGDLGFIMDTRDLQEVEMVARAYHFTRTRLLELCDPKTNKEPFSREQVDLVLGSNVAGGNAETPSTGQDRDVSLYRIYKVMFRVKGIVNVAWSCDNKCNDWLRIPLPLVLGRRRLLTPNEIQQQTATVSAQLTINKDPLLVESLTKQLQRLQSPQIPPSIEQKETQYPYFLFPYLISEDSNISHLKGRVYLDQDTQEGATSLLSSACTQSRRAAGLYFSKDVSDPNDDLLLQKNVFFKTGSLINSKISAMKLDAPDPAIFNAVQAIVVANQQETSQVNWAVNNRKDSRKTATEISASTQQQQQLSTVQVVLFSSSLRQIYQTMFEIIQSRVVSGLIKVVPAVLPMYSRKYVVKPAGDTDVIERQQRQQLMMQSWPVMQQTPAAQAFLTDMLDMLFPDSAPKYLAAFQQAQQAQQSQQQQAMQQAMAVAQQVAQGIIELSKHKDYFSEAGQLHAYPIVQQAAAKFEQLLTPTKQ